MGKKLKDMLMNYRKEIYDKCILSFQFNSKWKKIIAVQIIGYLLAILMSPISIRIIIDEHISGTSFITFPIISFIVWILLIVQPVVYAYIKRIEHRKN